MSDNLAGVIKEICGACGRDRTRMMDVVRAVQERCRYVSSDALDLIAAEMGVHRVEVESVVSFYSFLSERPKGTVVIRLCNDIIDEMMGADRVAKALTDELGIGFGEVTEDGSISLEHTPCLGMCDQAPAALVNDVVISQLNGESARDMVRALKADPDPRKLVKSLGDGHNADDLVSAMVVNNIREKGPVIFAEFEPGSALKKALAMHPAEVIREVKTARLRGRGGAGFPTGMKWDFTRSAAGEKRCVICNADEGEPGTFKDRVLLTECAELMLEGMTIAGYAIGATDGILYLRGEYAYLRAFLEKAIQDRREKNLLGKTIRGKADFSYDIRIQMGAGAYVCGEETALISSCEGLRGDPKDRPPFPAQEGYLARPTAVNNVETCCCVARILEKGAGWFSEMGSKGSSGTKLFSVSGDCTRPGVYELPFGTPLQDLLELSGAGKANAVQVGGASGTLVPPSQFERILCYDDLATGGAIMVFGPDRDVLEVASRFMAFFIEESCGYCTPCRVGNVLLKERLDRIIDGKGEPTDLAYLEQLGKVVKATSRCGLGQTSPNPILTTLENFRSAYESVVKEAKDGMQPSFDIGAALQAAESAQGRKSAYSDAAAK